MRRVVLPIAFLTALSTVAFGQTINRRDYKDIKKDKLREQKLNRSHAEEAALVMRGMRPNGIASNPDRSELV